jgi:large subunit ribosomal protein L14
MKPIRANITKALPVGTYLTCADNTGAKVLQIIAVFGYKGVKRRIPKSGVGNMIKVVVKQGNVNMRKQMFNAVVIRQKAEYRRRDGLRVSFEDNAAVLTDEKGEPKGTGIKGPIAKEAIERFSTLGKIANIVV